MKLLEERILKDGDVLGENILKVDSFLTHQVNFELMQEIGKVFADKYKEAGITKVVTIAAGVGFNETNLFISLPNTLQMFLTNGIVISTLTAVVLNIILNGLPKKLI